MGKFIVIEGLDGSGKSTQIKLLKEYFEKNNILYKYLHFTRMDECSPIFGELIARFLRGEFGNINEVNPYLVALLYAGDREHAKTQIAQWLEDGYNVLVDRYIYSNIAFQCAKSQDIDYKKKLEQWIINLEYDYYKIPKPDIKIFLHVPFSFVKANLSNNREGNDRNYLKGTLDIHEKDIDFQQKVEDVYLNLIETFNIERIDCQNEKGEMSEIEDIHNKIIELIKVCL